MVFLWEAQNFILEFSTDLVSTRADIADLDTQRGKLDTKKGCWLKVHETHITFHIKSCFSYFKNMGSKNHIFHKLAHQNTSFPLSNWLADEDLILW